MRGAVAVQLLVVLAQVPSTGRAAELLRSGAKTAPSLQLRPYRFPVGFDTGPALTSAQLTTASATVTPEAQQGMSIVMLYHSVPMGHTATQLADIKLFMDQCSAIGVAVAYDLSKLVAPSGTVTKPRMLALQREVEAVMTHPAIVRGGLFYLSDEPDGQNLDAGPFHDAYELVKRTAPRIPVAICVCDVPPNWSSHLWPRYVNSTDIIMLDVYPVSGAGAGPLTQVSGAIDTVRATVGPTVPIWLVAQAFGGGEGWPREPSQAEERVMVYLSWVHGSSGLLWFSHNNGPGLVTPSSPALWSECRQLALEAAVLGSALLQPADIDVLTTASTLPFPGQQPSPESQCVSCPSSRPHHYGGPGPGDYCCPGPIVGGGCPGNGECCIRPGRQGCQGLPRCMVNPQNNSICDHNSSTSPVHVRGIPQDYGEVVVLAVNTISRPLLVSFSAMICSAGASGSVNHWPHGCGGNNADDNDNKGAVLMVISDIFRNLTLTSKLASTNSSSATLSWVDVLEPYATRAYRISHSNRNNVVGALALATKDSEPDPSASDDNSLDAASTNLIENGSFEQMSNPGTPDGFYVIERSTRTGASFLCDGTTAVDGRYSMRVVTPANNTGKCTNVSTHTCCVPCISEAKISVQLIRSLVSTLSAKNRSHWWVQFECVGEG
eukprot:SAG31_NODE_1461_length_8244_cov_4.587109_2_plen_663_part_00